MATDNFAGRLVEAAPDSRLVNAAEGEAFSCAEIACMAGRLRRAGLTPDSRILIVADRTAQSAIAYLGAMYAGLTPVLAAVESTPESLDRLVVRTAARAAWFPSPRQVRPVAVEPGGVFVGLDRGEPIAPVDRGPDDIAALMPTSGSTGTPRLVRVTHGNLVANTEAIVRSQGLRSDDRAMLILPIHYCFGASVLHSHLAVGGDVVFDSRFMLADKVLTAIGEHGCTTFAGVPTAYLILARRSRLGQIPMPTLRRFLQAGGRLDPSVIDQIRQRVPSASFFVMYGQTEATARLTTLSPDDWPSKAGSVGRAMFNVELAIAGAGPGCDGEVLARGPSICPGYLDDPASSSDRFVDGWLHTGDFGRLDADGFLWITGRLGDFVKMRGVRLALSDVETIALAESGVLEAAACGVPHEEAGEAVALFMVPSPDADREAICQAVRRRLPFCWDVPVMQCVDNLPRTSSGKVDKSVLSERACGGAG